MRLYIAEIKDVKPGHINMIDAARRKKSERYRFEDDKKRCVLGGLLMRDFLGGAEVYEDENGKPLAKNGVWFNLSHSGEYVAFAVGDNQVGCDIEKLKIVPFEKMGKLVFCENEMEKIKSSPDKMGEFFELWTKKEALLKCMGDGFHRPPKSVDVSRELFEENGKTYRFMVYAFADYVLTVCTAGGEPAGEIEFVKY